MKTFIIIWFGQFVSRIGTAMTRFALLIWVFEQTGSAITVALLGFFSFLLFVLVSPIAGVWVDRLDRRKIMLLADLGAGLMTMGVLLLYATGHLELWHLYLAGAVTGAFEALQVPAYTAVATVLLPKKHYARAGGLRATANSGAEVIAPFLAGVLLVWLGLISVMVIDLVTFVIALLTLVVIRIPQVADESGTAPKRRRPFWQEVRVGFSYIWQRSGLFYLLLIFAGINLFAALTYYSILPAMILARTHNNEMILASVQGALGAAGVVGGLVVSAWGGPRRKIHGVLTGAALSFLLGDLLFAVGHTLPVWIAAAFASSFFVPMIISSHQAILQTKTPPAVQGRVFSVYGMARQATIPIGYLVGGALADYWLEPAMQPDGLLAPLFGQLTGTGPGTGMALMFLGTAGLGCAMSLLGYLVPTVRYVEDDLPDYDLAISSPTTSAQIRS